MVQSCCLSFVDRRGGGFVEADQAGGEKTSRCHRMKPLSLVIITYDRPKDALELARNIAGLEELDQWVEEVIFVNNRSTVSYQALEEFVAAHPAVPFRYSV